MTTRLLVLVDESPASKRAVSYVARMVGRRRGFQLCLAHLLPPLPAGLMEFRGAENIDVAWILMILPLTYPACEFQRA